MIIYVNSAAGPVMSYNQNVVYVLGGVVAAAGVASLLLMVRTMRGVCRR